MSWMIVEIEPPGFTLRLTMPSKKEDVPTRYILQVSR